MTRTDSTPDPATDPVSADAVVADPSAPGSRRGRRAAGAGPSGLLTRWAAGLSGLLIALGVWTLLTSGLVTDDPVIGGMSPAETWSGFDDLLDRGVLLSDAAVSLYRLVAGLGRVG